MDLKSMLKYTKDSGASDLHIIANSKPVIRLHKELRDIPYTSELNPRITEHLVKSQMSEKQFEDLQAHGEVDFSKFYEGIGSLRFNVYKQSANYSAAIRLIPEQIPKFESLGLPDAIRDFAHHHKGLVLVTGATGSGKSTTLASLIGIINETYPRHIITMEDPIEYVHKHNMSRINQRQIGTDTRNFATALRAALREDPDVILVGEMRDPETIKAALTAAETGHLVFSTLHTIGAAKTIDRIVDSFPPDQQQQIRMQLSTTLKGVVSQELLQKQTGDGVVCVTEVMITTPAIQNLIREGKTPQMNSVIQTGTREGMNSFDISLVNAVKAHHISKETALERANDKVMLAGLLERV
ncbi:type IV pilus twitching motility protein PilT [Acidaminobacter sp. JC074]|nr:type IV pilus twitching motility protein PilT [Acidaminobacter sp. JC074]